MQRDGLVADEVVARLEVLRDRRRPAAVLVDHLAAAPEALGQGPGDEPGLVDLEPDAPGGIEALAVAAAARHPGHHGPDGVRPRAVPVRDDLGARGGGGHQRARRARRVARHRRQRRVLDRVVRVPLALDGRLARRRVVRHEALVRRPADVVGQDAAVGRGRAGEEGDGGELHIFLFVWLFLG